MKKKIILILLVLIVVICLILAITSKNNKEEDTTTYKDTKVSKMTIENNITSSGEITGEEVTIELNTYRYFKEMYFEVGDSVKKGEKILKYTNGTYYKAPYDLVITDYNLPDAKEKIKDNNYLKVIKTSVLEMTLNIDETQINDVSEGNEVKITLSALDDKEYTGKITFINQIGNYSNSGTKYTALVEFENDGNVKIGMSASAEVTIEKEEDVIAVPIEAIISENNKKYVLVVNNNKTEQVEVETGISSSAYVEIKSGLSGDETIRMIDNTSSDKNSFGMNERGNEDFGDMNGKKDFPSGGMPNEKR